MQRQQMIEEIEEEGPSRCSTILYYTWKVCTCLFSHVLLVSMVVTYCILGAFTFRHLEADNELEVKRNISRIRSNVTADLWRLTDGPPVLHQENWTRAVVKRLQVFEHELVRCVKRDGWDGTEDEKAVQWTLIGALFYSIIVITTIGYGHIAPKTHWGKVVTIFYAILGIPLMLLCLSNIGDIMAHSFRFLYWRVCCYACTRRPRAARLPPPLVLAPSALLPPGPGGGPAPAGMLLPAPPGHQFRRARSMRTTTRSLQSSSRFSGRSRTASFRRSARASQRSADSALGLSRSSYSDTDCRYYDDTEREAPLTPLRPASQPNHNPVQRLPDPPVVAGATELPGGVGAADAAAASRTPVLFNKYALDREESTRRERPALRRPHRRFLSQEPEPPPRVESPPPPTPSSAPPTGPTAAASRLLDIPTPPPMPPSPVGSTATRESSGRSRGMSSMRSGHVSPSRPRVMTPMGFAISRQGSRMSRLREPEVFDDELYEYELYTGGDSLYGSQQHPGTRPVPIWLCMFLVVTYIFCGAYLFHQWEGWQFLDSAYFCFITLTTIGFGDFVPARRMRQDENAEIGIALCSLYLLFGIALLAMSFNLVQEEVIGNVKAVARRLGIIKDDDDDDD
ncbi:uncharacterized protein LOC126284273 [Schistocerca gregaria]|uniref:uncharacterized protein LOC126284273 n=1 Tax=Schistocerca gregaria TaxID=7010 RepID=UPI00211E41BB|nr:uncharacterized protein LOC126284273 [Schistocerca gregaria]